MVLDPVIALETLISLGFQRVLTSGCDTSALEGLPLIKRLIDQVSLNYMYDFTLVLFIFILHLLFHSTGQRENCHHARWVFNFFFFCFLCLLWCWLKSCWLCLLFITGGGITERNLQRILEGSGAQEFHCSARSSKDSAMKFRYGKIKNILSRSLFFFLFIELQVRGMKHILTNSSFAVQEHFCDDGSCSLSTWVQTEGGRREQSPHS